MIDSENNASITRMAQGRRFSGVVVMPMAARVASLLRAMLREIFDESSYQRFLERNQMASSAAAYAMFQRENSATKARRPRCC